MHSRSRYWRFHGLDPFEHFDRFERACAEGAWAGSRRSARWAERAAARARRFESRRFEEEAFGSGAGLGVRRPLRYLTWKLELDDGQTAKLARILERLKLERAQASLDQRRAAADLADALESEAFTREKVDSANALRGQAAQRVEAAITHALEELHGCLEPDQRARLAELVRTGSVRI